VLTTIKFKIENCAKTYEDFSLLYLKAKLFLVKRLIDMKTTNVIFLKNRALNSLIFDIFANILEYFETNNDQRNRKRLHEKSNGHRTVEPIK
jgi:hypothetical protein